jgi:transposase
MNKKKKHGPTFKLKVIKEHLRGESITAVALRWGLSRSLLTRWVDHYNSSGNKGIFRKTYQYHSSEFKLKVVESYRKDGLSLRDCCLNYGIAHEGTVLSWVRKYEQSGLDGLRRACGRPKVMKENIPPKKTKPLTRLEELERENLYLRAENELLKKLEALAQQKRTQKKKR